MHFVCTNIFGAIVLKLRFVVMIIWSIVIIINSVLTLQVSTASLSHYCEPCEIKVVSNHTCSLNTCVCAGLHRVRIRLSGLINGRNQFNSWGLLKCPIPVRVCAEHILYNLNQTDRIACSAPLYILQEIVRRNRVILYTGDETL
jgi:hypothetical protein